MRKIVVSFVALGFLAAPMLMLQGCGNLDTGDTVNTAIVDNSGQDNSVYNNYPDGTVLTCTDANCSLVSTETITNESDAIDSINDGNTVVGVYSDEYTQTECSEAGFFYCTIDNLCLDQPVSSGTCN